MKVKIAAAVVLLSGHAAAASTAGEMYELCTSNVESGHYRLCQGYMAGFSQGVFGLSSVQSKKETLCLPEYFTGNELMAIFLRRMKSLPRDGKVWTGDAGQAMLAILMGEFPCSK
jgi:hypothetical protein